MSLKRAFAVIASGVLALAGTGLASAGAASASPSPPAYLCVVNTPGNLDVHCAWANGNTQVVTMVQYPHANTTNWYYPTSPTRYGEISQAGGGNLCMQVENDGAPLTNSIYELPCSTTGLAAQEWLSENAGSGYNYYKSEWGTNECLAYDAYYEFLYVYTCNGQWYEKFYGG
jgi:hypothetical protein